MNATKIDNGTNKNSRRKNTKATSQTIGRFFRMDATPKRCQRGSERQTEVSSYNDASNAFLSFSFLPKLSKAQEVNNLRNTVKLESDFYKSLDCLAKHYSIKPKQTKDFGFPYNIALALEDAEQLLKNEVECFDELQLIQKDEKTFFLIEERRRTGSTLYYIPIIPLYRLSKNRNRSQSTQLLKSVCSYLYHCSDIPYYRQNSSYLYWIYEMVGEWLTSDDNSENLEELNKNVLQIKQAEQIGDFMEQKIYNVQNLNLFEEHLKCFKIKDGFDNDCFDLASKVLSLYKQYPNEKIYRNAKQNQEIENYEEETIISMDKYISFCAEANGSLFQSLFDSINCEFQESTVLEEPIIFKQFDGSLSTTNNLDFENRLFPLIEELIFILNKI